jgi:hypothetical protein
MTTLTRNVGLCTHGFSGKYTRLREENSLFLSSRSRNLSQICHNFNSDLHPECPNFNANRNFLKSDLLMQSFQVFSGSGCAYSWPLCFCFLSFASRRTSSPGWKSSLPRRQSQNPLNPKLTDLFPFLSFAAYVFYRIHEEDHMEISHEYNGSTSHSKKLTFVCYSDTQSLVIAHRSCPKPVSTQHELYPDSGTTLTLTCTLNLSQLQR